MRTPKCLKDGMIRKLVGGWDHRRSILAILSIACAGCLGHEGQLRYYNYNTVRSGKDGPKPRWRRASSPREERNQRPSRSSQRPKKVYKATGVFEPTTPFQRRCVDGNLGGCDQIRERRARVQLINKQVEEHLAAYGPLVDQLVKALKTPQRLPAASVESKLVLSRDPLDPSGPHTVRIKVSLAYQRGEERHPNWQRVLKLLSYMRKLNMILSQGTLNELAVRQIKGSMFNLRLEGDRESLVAIPSRYKHQFKILPEVGTVTVALVTTKPGIQYKVLWDRVESLTPAFYLSRKPGVGIVISPTNPGIRTLEYTAPVKGEQICDSLRSELRLLAAGSPRMQWLHTPKKKRGGP